MQFCRVLWNSKKIHPGPVFLNRECVDFLILMRGIVWYCGLQCVSMLSTPQSPFSWLASVMYWKLSYLELCPSFDLSFLQYSEGLGKNILILQLASVHFQIRGSFMLFTVSIIVGCYMLVKHVSLPLRDFKSI